jgi:hypothetical protein
MPDIRAIEGQALFDMPLNAGMPLHDIWDKSEVFDADSPYEAMRYYRPLNLLVREYFEGDLDTGPEDVEEAIEVSERHLTLLSGMGLTIVRHCVEPSPADIKTVVPGLGQVKAYGVSPFIPEILPLDQKEAHLKIPERKLAKSLRQPVHKYVDWCLKNHAPYVLDDVFSADQYSLHLPTGIVFLHDYDPILNHEKPRDRFANLTKSLFAARTAHN